MIHSASSLYEDVAFIAYHFHWSADEILDLDHPRRRQYIDDILHINARSQGSH